jgi:hypothetical protein
VRPHATCLNNSVSEKFGQVKALNSSLKSEKNKLELSQKDIDNFQKIKDMCRQLEKENLWKEMEKDILEGRRTETNLRKMRIIQALQLLSRFPAVYIDLNGLFYLAEVPNEKQRGIRLWFNKYCAENEAIDRCDANFIKHKDAPIHLKPYGVLIPNVNHSQRVTVLVSEDSRHTRPRTMYRIRTALETGLENAIILAQTSGELYESILSSFPEKELIETFLDKITFFVFQRLTSLMNSCGFVLRERGLELKKAIKSMSDEAQAFFQSSEPAQLKTVRYAKSLEEALEARRKRQLGIIYKYPEEDKWILSCPSCGSYTYLDTSEENVYKCKVCDTTYRED